VRDCLHPRDLVSLLTKQTAPGATAPARIINVGGGESHAMSLAELSAWCKDRFGAHGVAGDPGIRRFDIPWLIMNASLAGNCWAWRPQTPLQSILEEIAQHAEKNPCWLELSGVP